MAFGLSLGLFIGGTVVPGGGAPATPATVNSVTAGTWTGSAQPFTVSATGASNGDGVYWVIVPAANDDPSNTEVRAGQANGGGSPTESGNDTWPGPFSDTLVSGIANGSYKLCVVIDNGALSNVGVSASFTIDTTAPVLGTPLASESSGDIDWSVTSNEAAGEVYAALRASSDPVLSAENIINGTGDAVDTDSDDTPVADDTNGGSFLAPAVGTYRVDMVQVDDYGNVSSVVTSAEVEITASDAMGDDTGVIHWYGYDDTTRSGTDVTQVTDKTGNGRHLTSSGVSSAPQQANASAPIVFNGSAIIQTPTASGDNNLLVDLVDTAAGTARVFAVVDAATLGTTPGSFIFSESADAGTNQHYAFGANRESTTDGIGTFIRSRQFSDAVSAYADTGVDCDTAGVCIVEFELAQAAWEAFVNGVSEASGAVSTANLASGSSTYITLGGRASSSATSAPFTGSFYEIFITGTTDSTTLDAIRAQLAAKYSITL